MITVNINVIPHADQRYDTVGDWYWYQNTLIIRVSALPDSRFEFLVALHEFVEAMLCYYAGIDEQAITAFDKSYLGPGEPGASRRAPYHREHRYATWVERFAAFILNVNWRVYGAAVSDL